MSKTTQKAAESSDLRNVPAQVDHDKDGAEDDWKVGAWAPRRRTTPRRAKARPRAEVQPPGGDPSAPGSVEGLTSAEASARLLAVGPNAVPEHRRHP